MLLMAAKAPVRNPKRKKRGNMGGCNGKQYRPTTDETKVPCPGGYKLTDCIYPSEGVRVGALGLSPDCDLTSILNAMIKAIEDRDFKIRELERKLNKVI